MLDWDQRMYSIYKNIKRRVEDSPNFVRLLGRIMLSMLILMLLSAFFSPFVLIFFRSDMNWIPGNPRPLYFYDIEGCNPETGIGMVLDNITKNTDVRFQRLPYPLALTIGGLSYSCDSEVNYTEESEGLSASLISWNKIRISSMNESTILHRTLHGLGFGRSADTSSTEIDSRTRSFIQTFYANNIFAYLNLIPLNVLYVLLIVYIFVQGILKSIVKLIRIQMTKHVLD